MRKRNRTTLLCMILCAGMCAVFITGCGGEYAGLTEGDIVSGPAVSGEAVSGDSIKEKTVSDPTVKDKKDAESRKGKTDMSSHRFCTDTNLYYMANDYTKIMQARVDGTHRKCIGEWSREDYAEVIYADKNWLYYKVSLNSEDKQRLCRAPIEKDAEGQDVVRFRNAEELFKAEVLSSEYADSDYCFYWDWDADKLIKYDLKRKKKVSEEKNGWDVEQISRVNDHYLCVKNEEIYVQKIDSTQWKKVSVSGRYFDHIDYETVQGDRAVFVGGYISEKVDDFRVDIVRCDEKAATDFVTWEQMVRTVTEATGVEELDICYLEDYFWQEGRLYIQMQAGWVKDGLYHMEYMMISQGEDEDGFGSGLRYEKELTECMNTHVKERTGKWSDWDEAYPEDGETVFVEHMVVNDARCIAMMEGKAYLSLYDHEKDKGRLGCYDLDTKKFEWISEDSAAFYKLACDLNPIKYVEVFDDADTSLYVDFWSLSPSKDKEGDGDFVEDE